MKIAIVLGTRPEIIKMSPVVDALKAAEIEFFILHTGQHYSPELDAVFFEQLKLPAPRYNLHVGSLEAYEQVAEMISGIGDVLVREKPALVLVQGDTNSTLAGTLAANKCKVRTGHVEAGLRSYDRRMAEEVNRVLVDHCADLLLAPTPAAVHTLLDEKVRGQVHFTGNTAVDAVQRNLQDAHVTLRLDKPLPPPQQYLLVTIHRAENVDDRDRLAKIAKSLTILSRAQAVVYPIHPHTASRAVEFGIRFKGVTLIPPTDYLTFLALERDAALVLTDSGGVQEEACIIGVPCVTLRDNTERPETLEVGANTLSGVEPEKVLAAVDVMSKRRGDWENPFGDGRAAERIVRVMQSGVQA